MKSLFVLLAVVFATGLGPAFANEVKIDPRVENVFARQFTGAENVKWHKLDGGYQRVIFTLNGINAEAFYNEEAEWMGSVRNLFYNQLPLLVMQTVSNKFTDAVIVTVKEITTGDGTQYKIVLEQKDKKYSLRLNSLGNILEKERIKK
jgi:hypothetical protein